eukprot:scaffold13388_cov20-Tisochrysis_lutea.AAC.2
MLLRDSQVGAVRDYLGVVAIHALELRRQEAVALLMGAGMALVDVDAQEQVPVIITERWLRDILVSQDQGRSCPWILSHAPLLRRGMEMVAISTPMEAYCCVGRLKQGGFRPGSFNRTQPPYDCALNPLHILHAYFLRLLTGVLEPA